MKLVKEYLEKRIEQLTAEAYDLEAKTDFDPKDMDDTFFIRDCIRGVTKINEIKQELQQALTLFNEEYEKQNIILNSINDKLTDINKAISPKQTN